MTLRPIKTESDYDQALMRISDLMKSKDQEALDELDILTTLVEAYEERRYPIPLPDPVDAILFRMEQQNMTCADLGAYIGGDRIASEVLSRKRPLTLKMIRALYVHLGIPAEVLIKEPTKPTADGVEKSNMESISNRATDSLAYE